MDLRPSRSLFSFSVLTALATLGLIGMGGLVTSKGVGMAVPDWPTSFGYNMFALPVAQWFHGGVFDEHTHRLWASTVGLLVVVLTRWLGGTTSRRPLLMTGGVEVVAGLALLALGPQWRGAGHFLCGIGGVVLLAGAAWFRTPALPAPLPALGWTALWMVQFQGLLGGLRVVLDQWTLGHVTFGLLLGLIHGCLGQAFFVLLGVIALRLSPAWSRWSRNAPGGDTGFVPKWFVVGTCLVVLQLVLGAAMRHQHAGLAIPDFPRAYGRWWPALDADALIRYNQNRLDESTVTAFQILLQMAHRVGAVAALLSIFLAWRTAVSRFGRGSIPARGAGLWLALVGVQAVLGASTIWTDKAADVATGHVVVGALTLLTGTLLILAARKFRLAESTEASRIPVPALAHPVVR